MIYPKKKPEPEIFGRSVSLLLSNVNFNMRNDCCLLEHNVTASGEKTNLHLFKTLKRRVLDEKKAVEWCSKSTN